MSTFITGFDLETTGLDWTKGERIIEACFQVWRLEDRACVTSWRKLINPAGQRIAPAAQKVHGIAAADVLGKPVFKEVAPQIDLILQRSKALVAHNGAAFDAPFLHHEMKQAGIDMPNVPIFDTMTEGMFASYDTKPPSLQELCWALGIDYDPAKAHAAEYDVSCMMNCFFAGADLGYFDLAPIRAEKEAA